MTFSGPLLNWLTMVKLSDFRIGPNPQKFNNKCFKLAFLEFWFQFKILFGPNTPNLHYFGSKLFRLFRTTLAKIQKKRLHAPPAGGRDGAEVRIWLVLLRKIPKNFRDEISQKFGAYQTSKWRRRRCRTAGTWTACTARATSCATSCRTPARKGRNSKFGGVEA